MNVYVEIAIRISSTASIFYRPEDTILVETSSARGEDKTIFLQTCVMTSYHAFSTSAAQRGALSFLLGQISGLQPRSPFDQNIYCISLPSMTQSRNGPTYFVLQISLSSADSAAALNGGAEQRTARATEASKEESNALKCAMKGFMNNLANDTSSFTQ